MIKINKLLTIYPHNHCHNNINLLKNINKIDIHESKNSDQKFLEKNLVRHQNINLLSDQFLQIMLAQIKYQDPINPMDNNQMTSQITNMKMALGIEKLINYVKDIKNNYLNLKLSSLIGHEIFLKKDSCSSIQANTKVGFEIAKYVKFLTINFTDSYGKIIYTEKQKNLEPGIYEINLKKFDYYKLNSLLKKNKEYKVNFYAQDENKNPLNIDFFIKSKIKGIFNNNIDKNLKFISESDEVISLNDIILIR